jgi:response regulator RpfG family c-di-GMP phosphodiesterase
LWIRRAALLHDIGKLGLGNNILENTERLSELDQRRYRQHVETGRRILSGIRGFAPIIPLVEAHHEHVDGSGFPCGLSGEQFPVGARIIAVANRFDWLLCGREPMPGTHHAMRNIAEQRGSVFDGSCIDALATAVLAGKIHAPLPR